MICTGAGFKVVFENSRIQLGAGAFGLQLDFIIIQQSKVEILTIHSGGGPAGSLNTIDEPVRNRFGSGA